MAAGAAEADVGVVVAITDVEGLREHEVVVDAPVDVETADEVQASVSFAVVEIAACIEGFAAKYLPVVRGGSG